MKKIISISLILLLLSLAVAGCINPYPMETAQINILLNQLESGILGNNPSQTMSCFADSIMVVTWDGQPPTTYPNTDYYNYEFANKSYSDYQFTNRNIDVTNPTNAKVSCLIKSASYGFPYLTTFKNRRFILTKVLGNWKITVVYYL